jgi:flagellar biosynthesis protein FlhB
MKRAVAIEYDADMSAPFVVAKERGTLALRLIDIAKDHGIEIVQDDALTESLFIVDAGNPIPDTIFEAVAALLAYVYRTRSIQ